MFFESLDPIERVLPSLKMLIFDHFVLRQKVNAPFKEGSTLSMGSRLSKNILQIGLIESGSLATFWSDWRSVTKVM